MIAHILYRRNSEHERAATDLAKRLEKLQVDVKLTEADSREGVALTELYDAPSRPSIILVRQHDGQLVKQWQHTLPTAEDVSYWAHS